MRILSLASFFVFVSNVQALTTENISILTQDGLSLSGVLTLPSTPISGAVLILQGSGNVGADGDVSGPMLGLGYHGQSTKLSEQISEALAKKGIASVRYSKRGKEDPSQEKNQIIPVLQKDATSALSVLRARFPVNKIGIVGLSEGATLATLVSSQNAVDAVFLLSLPTRSIDEVMGYIFLSWPTEILTGHLDPNRTGSIDLDSFTKSKVMNLSLMGVLGAETTVESLDVNHDHKISVTGELVPAYQKFYGILKSVLESPVYHNWYHSLKDMAPFSAVAPKMKTKNIFVYQGMDDAQVPWSWVVEDLFLLSVKPALHLYSGLGHCFSPMAGELGEVKTSGAMDESVLNQLSNDASLGLK